MSFSHSDHDFYDILNSGIDTCPLCCLEEENVKRSMKVLLYESVTKRQFRKDIRFSRICRKHYDMFNKSVKEDLTVAGLGPAIIFWDMIKSQMEAMEKGQLFKKSPDRECYFCKYTASMPERIANSAYNVLKSAKGLKAFELSESVICFDHFELLTKTARKKKDKPFSDSIKRLQIEKLNILVKKLRSFIDKHDYASKDKIDLDEANSLSIAFKTLLKIL